MTLFSESIVEEATLAWLEALGYSILYGPEILPVSDTLNSAFAQRESGRYPEGAARGSRVTPAGVLSPWQGLASPFSNPLHLFSI